MYPKELPRVEFSFPDPPGESSNLGIDLWSTRALWARAQAPEQPKASPMPGDNGFWFNDDQGVGPCRPQPAEQNPKYPMN